MYIKKKVAKSLEGCLHFKSIPKIRCKTYRYRYIEKFKGVAILSAEEINNSDSNSKFISSV